eukprot:361631-Chlamydomonas_euryale.AAC.5
MERKGSVRCACMKQEAPATGPRSVEHTQGWRPDKRRRSLSSSSGLGFSELALDAFPAAKNDPKHDDILAAMMATRHDACYARRSQGVRKVVDAG